MGIDRDRVTKFTVIAGPRGACKTLYMTSLVVNKLIKGYIRQLLGLPERQVWTNYPVGFTWTRPDGKRVYLESKPLNMEAFYVFDKELACGDAFIDEVDQWLDRQEWMKVTQKLVNKGITQIRKRQLNMTATLQDFNWLNGRAEFQTDIIVKCRESAFTPWGRKQNVDLGEVGFLTFRDKSGVNTGYTYDESGMEYQLVFQGKRFWDCYDTNFEFDPLESMTTYKLKKPVAKEIVLPGAEPTASIGKMNSKGFMTDSQKSDADVKYLRDIINNTLLDYRSNGSKVVKRKLLIGNIRSRTDGLYSEDEIESQLTAVKGLSLYHGNHNDLVKMESELDLAAV